MSAPYWNGSTGAITGNGLSNIVINGNNTGSISNTANGTNSSNHQNSYGVFLAGCTSCTVEGLKVSNIYVNAGSSSSATDVNGQYTACIEISGAATNSVISNNTVSQCKTGVLVSADSGQDASNVQIYGNNISDIDWGINAGGGDNGDTINNLVIHDNSITNWTNWQFPTYAMHQDGVIIYNYATGSSTLTATLITAPLASS